MEQARIVAPFPGEVEARRPRARARQRVPIRVITPRQRHRPAGIRQLPHAAQRIGQVIHEAARLLLTYAVQAVEISVRAITQDLRETRVQVEHVGGGVAVEGLLQPVTQAVVAKRVRVRALRERLQPVGGIENSLAASGDHCK